MFTEKIRGFSKREIASMNHELEMEMQHYVRGMSTDYEKIEAATEKAILARWESAELLCIVKRSTI